MARQTETISAPNCQFAPSESADASNTRYVVWIVTAAVLICAFVWSFFSQLDYSLDTIGLFNPIYTYLHYGKMTNPAYYFFNSMIVHPPTRYLVVALLMKAGIPFQYAMSIPGFFLILVTVLVIVTGRFFNFIKIALLCGLLIGTLQLGPIDLRPDLDVALAWFAGLVTLEAGRLQAWDPKRLFLGSFLLTAASGIHYSGGISLLGVFVYLFAGWRLANSRWKSILSIVAGGCLFGIPYLSLFVIPHWSEINSWLHSAQATGSILASIQNHRQTYKIIYAWCKFPLFQIIFLPLGLGIPIVMIAFPILFAVRQLRTMALASLPQLLFFLLLVRRKPLILGYFLPEFILYSCAISIVLVWALLRIEEHFRRPARLALPVASAVLFSAVLWTSPWIKDIYLRPRPDEFGIARAAGRRILGSNALVGVRFCRSYTDGGTHLYMLDIDLLQHSLGDLDLKTYFDNFDAIAEDPFMSEYTSNDQKKSLISWYVDGTLQLRGFYFSGPQEDLFHFLGYQNNQRSYLLLSTHPPKIFEGFTLLPNGREVAEYQEDVDGENVFVSGVCGSRPNLNIPGLEFSDFFPLPPKASDATPKGVVTFIAEKEGFRKIQPFLLSGCAIHEKRFLKKTLVSTRVFLATLKDDQDIKYHATLVDAINARYGPETRIGFDADSWPSSITFVRGPKKGESYDLSGTSTVQLFRSDIDSIDGWWASPQKSVHGLEVVTSSLKAGERMGDFKTDKWGGYIVSEFKSLPVDRSALFFSVWVKGRKADNLPRLSVQNETYSVIGVAEVLAQRNDGWTLLGGWIPRPIAQKGRLLIEQDNDMESFIDKASLVAVSLQTPVLKKDSHNGLQRR